MFQRGQQITDPLCGIQENQAQTKKQKSAINQEVIAVENKYLMFWPWPVSLI